MSFFGGLKRALGWSGDDEENEDYISYESSSDKQVALQGMKEETEANESVVLDFSDEIPEGVFDGLIEIVNANLSPMVLKCLDVEAEKKLMYEALGPKFSAFVKETRERSLEMARQEWNREKGALNGKIEDFKSRCDAAENEMREMKAMKMSEDRQKMALKERLRNLEDQIARAEAEKEQYDLENKSLLNKLKVSQVRSEANEEAEREIVELKAEIARMKAQQAEPASEDVAKELEDEYKSKMEVNNALINDLRAEAAKNKELLAESEGEVAELKAKLVELEEKSANVDKVVAEADEEKAKLTAELEETANELKAAKAEIEEMAENLSVLDDIQEQLEKVGEFKKKKEEEIQSLQEKVLELEQERAKLLESERDEDILKGRIAELEMELSACNEKVNALAQENSDTLDLLRKRDEAFDSQKAELSQLKAENEAMKVSHEAEVGALKTAEAEKVKTFQAEIAELQAKLNVNGKIDDALVEEDLRQAVEETFDVVLDESDFGVGDIMEEPVTESDVVHETETVADSESQEETPEAELDDIDWLLPDTAESIIKEEEVKKEKETKEKEELEQNSKKVKEEPEAQMSLFG